MRTTEFGSKKVSGNLCCVQKMRYFVLCQEHVGHARDNLEDT